MNNFKYIWISDNGENSCDVCRALHNTKYESLLDVPEKPHPNCKCVIKEINRFSENILTPAPWSGRNAMKNMYGNPIYEKSNGTREIYPSKHPNGSQEEKDAQAWNEIIEEELISQMSEKIKDFEDNNIKQNPKNMNFSQKGIEFLKEKENKVTDKNGQHIIYDDATGKAILAEQDLPNGATIGYGHLIQKGEDFSKGLNEVEAIELLKKDIRNAENIVKACISVPIKQNEFDSLVSLAYNIGSGNFKDSTIVKYVNIPNFKNNKYPTSEIAWKIWNKSQGKISRGLIKRRNEEWNIFKNGRY